MTKNSMKKYLPLLITIIPALFLYRMIIFGEIVTANDDCIDKYVVSIVPSLNYRSGSSGLISVF